MRASPCVVCVASPMSTEKKKMDMGMLRTGQVMLRNQFGVMGKKRRKRRKKNKLLRFSSTFLATREEKKRSQKEEGEEEEKGMRQAETWKQPRFLQSTGVADLPLQQGDLLREQLDHILLSKGSSKQETERGACGGEQAGQNQTLPRPEYGTGQHVLKDKHG